MRFLNARVLIAGSGPAAPEGAKETIFYKNPPCACCESHADDLQENGSDVKVVATHDLPLIERRHGIPEGFVGCPARPIDGDVVEGHVPLATLDRPLAERPHVNGISLPGMPVGSHGMSGEKAEPFTIYGFGGGAPRVYAVERSTVPGDGP